MSFCVNPILPNYSNQHFLALPSPTSVFTPKLLTCAGNPLLTPIFHRDLPENPQVLDSSSAHSLNFYCLYMCWTLRKSPKKEEESPCLAAHMLIINLRRTQQWLHSYTMRGFPPSFPHLLFVGPFPKQSLLRGLLHITAITNYINNPHCLQGSHLYSYCNGILGL